MFLERIKINIKFLFRFSLVISSSLFTLISILLLFVSWDDLGIKTICTRIMLFVGILIFCIILGIIYGLLIKKSNTIWENGNGKINICYSDIMKLSFPKRNNKNRIVVIPVNTCFDTIVDNNLAEYEKPLVSETTIHGMWIKKMIGSGVLREDLDKKISDFIRIKNISYLFKLSDEEKERGKKECYERGTVVVVKGDKKVSYFLLALSEFNENNNANCSKEELIECLHKLIIFYDMNGQGFDLYLPLMGTNLSRANLSHQESLNIISSMFELYSDKIHGTINIVIYNKDKDKATIFK